VVSGVRIRGPFTGPSGYDHHVREFTRALGKLGVSVQLTNLNEWSPVRLPHNLRDPWFESLSREVPAGVVLHFSFPTQVSPDPSRANVNFTMFEASRIPVAWVRALEWSTLVVVPTAQSRQAFVDSGVPESKMRLCPLAVRADRFRQGVPTLDLGLEGGRPVASFGRRFLNVSELGPRKNFRGLVRTWLRATTPDDDAVLILKVGCYTPGSLAYLGLEMAAAQTEANKRLDEAAPILIVHDILPDADMPRLFASASHYLSLSFGEGWDLSMMEAAASGLRLMAPAHTGYLAYLDPDIATMVPVRRVRVDMSETSWENALFAGADWWQPDEDAAVEMLRAAIEGGDVPRVSARDRIASRFTWEAAARRLIEVLAEAEAMAPV
jgi:glycosyltransferase involved in cell wall biosynthesis